MSEIIPPSSSESPDAAFRRATAKRVMERCQSRLLEAGVDLFDPDERLAVEDLLMAKLANPALTMEEAKSIHPKAEQILGITSDRDPQPGAPGAALEAQLLNEEPANDNAAPMQQAA